MTEIMTKEEIKKKAREYIENRLDNEGAVLRDELKSEVKDKFGTWPGRFTKDGFLRDTVIKKVKGKPTSKEKDVERALRDHRRMDKYLVKKKEPVNEWIFVLLFLIALVVLGLIIGLKIGEVYL